MPKLTPIEDVTELKTGDILKTTTETPTVRHFAVVFHRNGVAMVADNSFLTKRIDIFNVEDYLKQRNVIGVIRNEKTLAVTDQRVEDKIKEHRARGYRFFSFNCEDFVRDICDCDLGVDQRIIYLLVIPIIIVGSLVGLFYILKRNPINNK